MSTPPKPAPEEELWRTEPLRERSDSARARQRILRAARRVIETEGQATFTMDRVAAVANVGKGTIFRRFGDRAGLVSALLDDYLREFYAAIESGPPPLGPGAPARDRLEAYFIAAIRLQYENPVFATTAQMTQAQHAAAAFGPLHDHIASLLQEIDLEGDIGILTTMLLQTVSPAALSAQFELRGEKLDDVLDSIRILLGHITSPASSP